jgi:hypothetical protein
MWWCRDLFPLASHLISFNFHPNFHLEPESTDLPKTTMAPRKDKDKGEKAAGTDGVFLKVDFDGEVWMLTR